ncbi:hypothetical protein OAK75_01715 [Bacteriovoracales bacterium]|nr:hypothetical protein [Bacteriovoracales bacterium]
MVLLFFSVSCTKNYRVETSKIKKTFFKHIVSSFIDNPKTLEKLEKSGLNFGHWFSGSLIPQNNNELYKNSYYRSMIDEIKSDLDSLKNEDPLLSVTMSKSHRLFNWRWGRSKYAHFELVGVSNRLDRLSFSPKNCGEVRLIYRLAYNKSGIRSRLPFTVNVVFWAKDDDGNLNCNSIAKSWIKGRKKSLGLMNDNEALNKKRINIKNLKSVEINLQSIRWPSTVRPDMGGYAEYIMRVFKRDPKSKKFKLSFLENTPNFSKLKNKSLKIELLRWIKRSDNLKKLDQGILVIPEKYLAKKATSFALHGSSRFRNRPFDRLFKKGNFKDISYKGFKFVKSPAGVLRRLNDLTCIGCHQGRSVAGFHFLGIDKSYTSPVNFINSPMSSHFLEDQNRKKSFILNLATNKKLVHKRPFSERAEKESGKFGSHCGLKKDPSFRSWTCKEGLVCQKFNKKKDALVGECYDLKIVQTGGPCQVGELTQRSDPHRDRIKKVRKLTCAGSSHCEISSVGFPGGMCSSDCSNLGKNATCGSIAILFGFNQCLARGNTFDKCLIENIRPAALRKCNLAMPCRDDYICARTVNGKGACIPPYFLFQLRVDGHPRP